MTERQVDHNAIRTNQVFTISVLALAFVLDLPALAALQALLMLLSAAAPHLGPYTRFYRHVLRPAGIVQPDLKLDNPEPHRFAQLVGSIFVGSGFLALVAGVPVVGWALVGVVIVLASLNLFAGWCAGCMMYYWLNRLGVPGFARARIEVTQ
jgi:hypothetical protein